MMTFFLKLNRTEVQKHHRTTCARRYVEKLVIKTCNFRLRSACDFISRFSVAPETSRADADDPLAASRVVFW